MTDLPIINSLLYVSNDVPNCHIRPIKYSYNHLSKTRADRQAFTL